MFDPDLTTESRGGAGPGHHRRKMLFFAHENSPENIGD